MLDGMSDSIQRSRIENLHSREVDRQSPTGLIFCINFLIFSCPAVSHAVTFLRINRKIFTNIVRLYIAIAFALFSMFTASENKKRVSLCVPQLDCQAFLGMTLILPTCHGILWHY